MSEFRFEAIGTPWTIATPGDLASTVSAAVVARAAEFDRTYSRFRPDSLVSRFAGSGGTVEFPSDSLPLLEFYQRLYDATGGAVSPLVGRALEQLGYGPQYTLRRRPERAPVPAWDAVLAVAGTQVTATEPVMLDFGAAGKGYLVDLLAGVLKTNGYPSFVIDGSGDMIHAGADTVSIGLEDPRDASKVIGVADLTGAALCASATNRRRWGPGLHHIIDAHTGEPVSDVIASWVVAGTAMVADGLATALFLTPPAHLAALFSFSYVRMFANGVVEYSPDFEGELFH